MQIHLQVMSKDFMKTFDEDCLGLAITVTTYNKQDDEQKAQEIINKGLELIEALYYPRTIFEVATNICDAGDWAQTLLALKTQKEPSTL